MGHSFGAVEAQDGLKATTNGSDSSGVVGHSRDQRWDQRDKTGASANFPRFGNLPHFGGRVDPTTRIHRSPTVFWAIIRAGTREMAPACAVKASPARACWGLRTMPRNPRFTVAMYIAAAKTSARPEAVAFSAKVMRTPVSAFTGLETATKGSACREADAIPGLPE